MNDTKGQPVAVDCGDLKTGVKKVKEKILYRKRIGVNSSLLAPLGGVEKSIIISLSGGFMSALCHHGCKLLLKGQL